MGPKNFSEIFQHSSWEHLRPSRFDPQTGPPRRTASIRTQEGGCSGPWASSRIRLGSRAPPQGAHQVRQPLRPVAQGEPPPVSQQAGRGAAQLLKGAVGLPGLAPVPAVSRLEVGGIGDDQVEPAGRQGHLPPVRLEDRPLQAAVGQVLPGTLGRPLLPPTPVRESPPPGPPASGADSRSLSPGRTPASPASL